MKKLLIAILFLFFANSIFSHENLSYVLTNSCSSYKIDMDNHETKKLKEGQKITCIANFIDAFEDNNQVIGPFFYNREDYYLVPVYSLKPINSENLLPEKIISITNTGITKKIIPAYFLELLSKKDTNMLGQYEDFFLRQTDYIKAVGVDNQKISEMFTNDFYNSSYSYTWGFSVISNAGIKLFNSDTIYFNNIIKKSESVYDCEGIAEKAYDEWNPEENFWNTRVENTPIGKSETFTITIDGDYITLYNKTRETNIITLVCVNNSVLTELSNLFVSNNCNLSKVTWPRHADGTCDYNRSKKTTASQTSKAMSSINITPNKTMTVKEKLKLRSGEATSIQVLTVMSAGTKVKILELGKAETIDGISSKWVKVEVQTGA